MRGHALQLLRDVAVIHQHRHLFEQALPVELVSRRRDQSLRKPLLVALFDFRAQCRHSLHGLGQAIKRRAQNGLERFAFTGAHHFQLFQQRPDRASRRSLSTRRHPRLSCCGSPIAARRAYAGPRSDPAHRSTEIRTRLLECLEVAGDQIAIVAGLLLRRAID